MAIFKLGNRKPADAKSGELVGWDNTEILISPKARRQHLKNAPVHCRAEDTRTLFSETQA
jgi:hypothetical protein